MIISDKYLNSFFFFTLTILVRFFYGTTEQTLSTYLFHLVTCGQYLRELGFSNRDTKYCYQFLNLIKRSLFAFYLIIWSICCVNSWLILTIHYGSPSDETGIRSRKFESFPKPLYYYHLALILIISTKKIICLLS